MFKHVAHTVLTILVLALLAGCASNLPPPTPRAGDYDQGYADGCSSGKRAQGSTSDEYRRDMGRFGASPDYVKGWYAGYYQCSGQDAKLDAAGGAR